MWKNTALYIIRYRLWILLAMVGLTALMGYYATKVEITFGGNKVLPATDSSIVKYNRFTQTFGEDGTVMVIGAQTDKLFTKDFLSAWQQLGMKIEKLHGVKGILSIANAYDLQKDTANRIFKISKVFNDVVNSDNDAKIIEYKFSRLPFYDGLLLNKKSNATLMAITFDNKKLDINSRKLLVDSVVQTCEPFAKIQNVPVHYSGLPYVRTMLSQKILNEFKLLLALALAVSSILLLIFFRSISSVVFPILVVVIGVVTSLGTMALFGYKITLLTGLIPPLIVVIGIPNSILLLNKYHTEFKRNGMKQMALIAMIRRIGTTTFIANVTTAIGFGVFYFTHSDLLMEFGIIAALNIMLTYVASVVLIPIILSYLPEPKLKHTAHLDRNWLQGFINFVSEAIQRKYRPVIYFGTLALCLVSVWGITKIDRNGYVIDDLPKNDPVLVDLKFFEKNFKGILPFEIAVNTRKINGAVSTGTIYKIEKLNKAMLKYPEFSRGLCINELLKFSTQGFYNGNPNYYRIPNPLEKGFILSYAARSKGSGNMLNSFVDSTKSSTRITYQLADVGSDRMNVLLPKIQADIDSIFPKDDYEVEITGASVLFVKGNNYLIKNLIESLLLAIFLISIIMFLLFRNTFMIAIAILPNIIPLAITAGVMGFCGIPLKPSAILIFSIAFGLASDQTIYFLSKYRQELKNRSFSIADTVQIALREAGISMTYTAIILLCGFSIFMASSFGGTVILGMLVALTLLVAVLYNLIMLPALLMTLERYITRKAATAEPLLQVYDEEEDLDIDNLKLP